MQTNHQDIWLSEVRDYEVDYQSIVNNANYFHYMEQARSVFCSNRGIKVQEYATQGINVVLITSNIQFKSSLKFGDSFLIETTLHKISKIRYCFHQTVYAARGHEKITCVIAENTVCAVQNGKPICLDELARYAI